MKSRLPYLLFLGSALALVLGSFAASFVLLRGNLLYGDQFTTTWTEELSIYSTWKVAHGYPAYEWPVKDWYSLSMYNWLFYQLYGLVGKLSHTDGMQAVFIERTLTFLFGCAGCALTYKIAQHLVEMFGLIPQHLILATGSLLLWFAWGGMLCMAFTIRPDMAALTLSLAGLGLFLWAMRGHLVGYILSGLCFYLAWAMKQSTVFTCAGCLLYLVIALEWRLLFLFALSFFLPIALTLGNGGEIYRYNVLYAPSISPILWQHRLEVFYMLVLHGLFIFGLLAYLPSLLARLNFRPSGWNRFAALPLATRQISVVLLATGIAGIMDLLILGKEGSDMNATFEFLILAALLALAALHHLLQTESRHRARWLVYVSVLFLISALVPAKNAFLFPYKLGVTPVITPSLYQNKIQYGEWLKTLPAPLLVRDAIFSLPWYSNHGNYPAILTDFLWYPRAQSQGLLDGGGIQTLVQNHHFATLLLFPDDELLPVARAAGYREVPLPPEHLYYQSSRVLGQVGPLVFFVRPSP